MSKRLLAWDGSPGGTATWWHEDGDGDWAIEMMQDVTALLDANKEAQNHCYPYFSDRSAKLVARIPHIVIELWRVRYGIDYYSPDPDVQKKVDQLLNSSEWCWLRVGGGTL
jgi:hypothetical protein